MVIIFSSFTKRPFVFINENMKFRIKATIPTCIPDTVSICLIPVIEKVFSNSLSIFCLSPNNIDIAIFALVVLGIFLRMVFCNERFIFLKNVFNDLSFANTFKPDDLR